jgi:hypothetical protein
MNVGPAVATADHTAAAPGNEQQFKAVQGYSLSGTPSCETPALQALAYPTWTNPDPLDINISSGNGPGNGLTVCKDATSGPVTLTATSPDAFSAGNTLTSTVQLTCK